MHVPALTVALRPAPATMARVTVSAAVVRRKQGQGGVVSRGQGVGGRGEGDEPPSPTSDGAESGRWPR